MPPISLSIPGKNNKDRLLIPELFIVIAILSLAAYFRLVNLRSIPDWFQDEGEFIRLADQIVGGNYGFLGIRGSTLLIGRPPIFFWIIAGLFKLVGADIVFLRSFTAICSLLTCGIGYLFARQALNRTSAVYTLAWMAIIPEYVFYNRLGFTYNLFSGLVLLFAFAVWKYLAEGERKWLAAACLGAGLGLACDFLGLVLVLFLILILLARKPADLWYVLTLAPLPLVIALLPALINAPGEIWNDLIAVVLRGGGISPSLGWNVLTMISAYGFLIQRQTWIVLGLIGLLALPDQRLRNLLLALAFGLLLPTSLGRGLAAHYLLPVWPLFMIGLGSLTETGVKHIFNIYASTFNRLKPIGKWRLTGRYPLSMSSGLTRLIVLFLVFSPFIWMLFLDSGYFIWKTVGVQNIMPSVLFLDGYVPASDAQAISEAILKDLKAEDLVIAPGTVYWLLPGRAVDIRTVALYEAGGKIPKLAEIDPARFIGNNSLDSARYVVVDNTWRHWWARDYPEIADLLQKVSKWPLLMEQGSLEIYYNPMKCCPEGESQD